MHPRNTANGRYAPDFASALATGVIRLIADDLVRWVLNEPVSPHTHDRVADYLRRETIKLTNAKKKDPEISGSEEVIEQPQPPTKGDHDA